MTELDTILSAVKLALADILVGSTDVCQNIIRNCIYIILQDKTIRLILKIIYMQLFLRL